MDAMMIVRRLEYLVALAREKHFARAALACNVSQPTLSAGIQQLEIDLGVQIVKRGHRFEGFTEAGELVLSWALRTTNDAETLRQQLKERRETFTTTLRIGVLGSAVPLMKIFTVPFQRRHPSMNLAVTIHDAFGIQQCIEEGSIDVAITYLDKTSRNYSRAQPLYVEEYELLIKRGTRFSGKASARWEDIMEQPLCLLSPNTRVFGAMESGILNQALTTTPHIVTNAIWLVMDHVRTGNWASVLPRPVRVMIAGDRDLEAIRLEPTGVQPTVGIVLPRSEPRSQAADAFFEIAVSMESLKTMETLLQAEVEPVSSAPRKRAK
jgi:DNA-binding transcriptional LysR family regulator